MQINPAEKSRWRSLEIAVLLCQDESNGKCLTTVFHLCVYLLTLLCLVRYV